MSGARRLFATGSDGFVGSALRKVLAQDGSRAGVEFVHAARGFDLLDPPSVRAAVDSARPDLVMHLAGQSSVSASFADPRATLEVNLFGTLNLLEALKAAGFRGRMLYVGSADVYGTVDPQDMPIRETQPLRPLNPYAVSKIAAESLCFQWVQTEGMDIVLVRPFNHIGPGQSENFVVSGFAKQIVEIKLGRRAPVIEVGDVDVARDFTDVRDVIQAYLQLLHNGSIGEVYNVCSGTELKIRDLLDMMLGIAGVSATVKQDPARLRNVQQRNVVASCAKLVQATGWKPRVPLARSLSDVLAEWETRLRRDATVPAP